MDVTEVNRLPALPTVTELVQALVARPDFRGMVIYDPNHAADKEIPPITSFDYQFKSCDPLILASEMIAPLAKIPRGPSPPPVPQPGNGQPH